MSEGIVSQVYIRRRLLFFFGTLILATLALIGRLAYIQIVQADELYGLAWQQWNRSIPTRSPRGTIYDCHGRLLAGSVTVETVVAIPPQVEDPERTARLLAPLLEMEEAALLKLLTMDRSAIYLKRKVESEVSQQVRDLDLPGIAFTPEGKRFYAAGTLASQILGFVGMDQGWAGLEIYYEEQLKGRDGRLLFPSDAWGRQLPYEVRSFVPPREGLNLYLTIDETIQYIIERELARAMLEFQPRQAIAIAADPRTGAILAAVSKPDFDPNRYGEYPQEDWALAPVTRTFEPGSTFKLTTLAAAIEEGLFNGNEYFFCNGYVNIAGHDVGCWTASTGGHGSISFIEVVESSCNPGFICLGNRLGAEKLFDYIRAFGYGAPLGIDYPGEGAGIVFTPEQVGPLELATTAFGQGISVTPLQQLMAVSALANGGFLMKPYLVQEIRDAEGTLIERREPEAIRQVVSRETSRRVTEIMEGVTLRGSGINAAIDGYRIATKTGTAQKVGPDGGYIPGKYILSLIGFAPADDPQIILYVAVDEVQRGPQWGSQVSAPIFRRIMLDVLNYLQVPPEDQAGLPAATLVEVPDLRGLTVNEASARLDTAGLMLRLVGEGDLIINQTPKAGATVPLQTQVVVHLGEVGRDTVLVVPELQGLTLREAGQVLSWLGLSLSPEGSGVALEQSPAAGMPIEVGAVVRVRFASPLDNNVHPAD